MSANNRKENHWLDRPGNIRKLKQAAIAALVLTIFADFFVYHKAYFGVDGTFGFGAWFGLLCALVFIIAAKAIGVILKRPDTYYDN